MLPLINARIELDILCDKLEIDIPKGKYTTLAGYILDKTHSIPKPGVEVKEDDLLFMVQKSSAQAVLEVKVSW